MLEGQRHGSVGTVFSAQVWGPAFGSLEHIENVQWGHGDGRVTRVGSAVNLVEQ